MPQTTGSRVEAHLQLDNQQQVLFLWFLVHLDIRRWEGISNAFNLKREGRNCEIIIHIIESVLYARTLLGADNMLLEQALALKEL